jgi:riboflavin kinase/FMN adenylyltransferase
MAFRVFDSPEAWAAAFAASGPAVAGAVLTIGNFDGLHLGHQKILARVVERARALGGVATAITFEPHPLKVLRPGDAPPQIQTLSQRLAGFEQMGLEVAVVIRFDLRVSRMSAEEFVRWAVVEKLRAREIHVGANFRFGHRHAGDVHLLEELGPRYGFAVQIVSPVVACGEIVSSTSIRTWLQQGAVGRAARLLGQPFVLTGRIIAGTGTGRRLLLPTLNLDPDQELLPARGVYATETFLGDHRYRSATNIGLRPTFPSARPGRLGTGGSPHLTVETHLLDFSEERQAGAMEIHFWKRLRDERNFAGPDELRTQIEADLRRTRRFFRLLDKFRRGPKIGV